MKTKAWKKWALAIATGSVLLQNATCAAQLAAVSSTITAGGVIFIISRILGD